jgi:hypothetical protein
LKQAEFDRVPVAE